MKPYSAKVEEQLETVRSGLRELLLGAASARPMAEWSRELGRHSQYLARALGGRSPLPRFAEAAALLELTGTDARAFFWGLFPRRGAPKRALTADRDSAAPGLPLADLWEEMAARRPPPGPAELVEQAAELLRRYLALAGRDAEGVSRELFGSVDAVRYLLTGRSELSFEKLFVLLEALDRRPWRFFVDLLGPKDDTLAPGITWWSLLDGLDGSARGGGEGPAEMGRRRGLPRPVEGARSGEGGGREG